MAYATYYKDILDLNYPDCNACEIESWTYPLSASTQQVAKENFRKYDDNYAFITKTGLFSAPITGQGWPCSKRKHYLAMALIESGKSEEQVIEAVSILKAGKLLVPASQASP